MDFSRIEDYFIEKRDDYYLIELISAVEEDLDMDKLIEKVMATKDKQFINICGSKAKRFGLFTDEEIEKIKEKFKDVLAGE